MFPVSRMIALLLTAALSIAVTAADAPPAGVVVETVRDAEISPRAKMTGVLHFARAATIAAEVEGRITAHRFEPGQRLARGDVMAEIDTGFVTRDLEIARSRAREIDAEIEQLKRRVRRLDRLRKNDLASRDAYDDAFYAHKVLVQRRATTELRIQRMQLTLDKSRIRAPFDGIVLEKYRELGDWLGKGDKVALLGDTSLALVNVPVSESLLRYQTRGAAIDVYVPALDRTVPGRIAGIVPLADLRSKSANLRIELPWEPGMIENATAEVEIATGPARALRLIPRDALLRVQGRDMVYTIADGQASPLPVHVVARLGDRIAVDDESITAGMPVIVDGNDRLKPGQAVRVIE